jgi:peptidoglycan/xylan/chitin deacetylase (PgdA/CDA1 family)
MAWVGVFVLVIASIVVATRIYLASREPAWSVSPFPNGHHFGFTIVHDADNAYSRRLAPIARVLDDLRMRVTFTVFVHWATGEGPDLFARERAEDEFFGPHGTAIVNGGELAFYQDLARRGHEIGMHTASSRSDTREATAQAFEDFRATFGAYPRTYVEHWTAENKETLMNEGAIKGGPYYVVDILQRQDCWVWIDGPDALPESRYFYDLIASNGSPFVKDSQAKYGLDKVFMRSGEWRPSDGDGFLKWYTPERIDRMQADHGLALVYTHFEKNWIDRQTREMRADIRERLAYIASKDGWFAPAADILDRFQAMKFVEIERKGPILQISNNSATALDGVTLLTATRRSLLRGPTVLHPNAEGQIVIGNLAAGERLTFELEP